MIISIISTNKESVQIIIKSACMKMICRKEIRKIISSNLLKLTELMFFSVIQSSAKLEYDFAENEDKARYKKTEIQQIYKRSLVSLLWQKNFYSRSR